MLQQDQLMYTLHCENQQPDLKESNKKLYSVYRSFTKIYFKQVVFDLNRFIYMILVLIKYRYINIYFLMSDSS